MGNEEVSTRGWHFFNVAADDCCSDHREEASFHDAGWRNDWHNSTVVSGSHWSKGHFSTPSCTIMGR